MTNIFIELLKLEFHKLVIERKFQNCKVFTDVINQNFKN